VRYLPEIIPRENLKTGTNPFCGLNPTGVISGGDISRRGCLRRGYLSGGGNLRRGYLSQGVISGGDISRRYLRLARSILVFKKSVRLTVSLAGVDLFCA